MVTVTTGAKQAVAIHNSEGLSLASGQEVLSLLTDLDFQEGWDSLYKECPWTTVFQCRAFVDSWYRLYYSDYLPVLVKSVQMGKLIGLLAMARDKNGLIVGAGDAQAEYQVWIASEANGETFIKKALAEVRKYYPGSKLQFKYLPAHTPVEWVKKDLQWAKHSVLEEFRQPLMAINGESIVNELKRKDRRNKINRLKRVGELRFERIVDRHRFAAIFDELALQYDFRKSAMYNVTFFQNGSLGKQFLFALYEKGLLHVTILRLNEELIGSVIGTVGKNKWVHFKGVNTHSLFYAKSSPGILHLLMLGKMLAEEGAEVFDLTPGADRYKEMLATNYAQVHKLTIGSAQMQLAVSLKTSINTVVKQTATKLGIKRRVLKKMKWQVYQFKNKMMRSGKQGFLTTLQGVAEQVFQSGKSKRYEITPVDLVNTGEVQIRKNDLRHLMDFDQEGGGQTRWEFHAEAMRRFEEGNCCYSWAESGRLLACIWLNRSYSDTTGNDTALPGESGNILHALYVHKAENSKLHHFLQSAAFAAMQETGGQNVCMDASAGFLCRALEGAGFKVIKEKP